MIMLIRIGLILLCFYGSINCQYIETFPIDNRGILPGSNCALPATCFTDFTGVDWTISGILSGIDVEGFYTSGGLLQTSDVDEEVCFRPPNIDISNVGLASFEVDITWVGYDASDYIDIEYRIDAGSWITMPAEAGVGPHTVQGTSNNNGSLTNFGQSGIIGNALAVRVCIDHNSNTEITTIDNFEVPQVGAAILPVTWKDFFIEKVQTGNLLSWSTSNELNNDLFHIERKGSDNNRWMRIGQLNGEGNSGQLTYYKFEDRDPLSDQVNYYRIKQVDFNGEFSFSDILSIESIRKSFKIYPNPTSEFVSIQLPDKIRRIELLEISGRKISTFDLDGNKKKVTFDVSNLSPGIYLVKTEYYIKRLVINK